MVAAAKKGMSATGATAIVCALMLVVVVFWMISKLSLPAQNCATIASSYPKAAQVSSFDAQSPAYSHNLRDYYISTAYDVCSSGLYKNDYVNLCALKSAIKQGVRCLDLAIYTVDGEPVVAASSLNEYTVKETYNSIALGEVINTIETHAFSGGLCPAADDPLILHIRLMTRLPDSCNKIAGQLQDGLGHRLLGPRYSYQDRGHNLGKVPLVDLRRKVVIIVDQSNTAFIGTKLEEYVNLASNAPFMRVLRYTDGVLQCGDREELLTYNKKNMSIVLPDRSIGIQNYPVPEGQELGCQMCALAYQSKDAEVQYDLRWFERHRSAFVLRPAPQRWIPIVKHMPPPPPESESYDARQVRLPFPGMTASI